jgi:hypothetical protein
MKDIIQSIQTLEKFHQEYDLKQTISVLQIKAQNKKRTDIDNLLAEGEIDKSLLHAALSLKDIVGQINVIIHAWGILVSLPYILQPDEIIEYVSLGAGNTGKEFDLKTSRQVAEFKFIDWKGGPETIRKNSLFKDFYHLAECEDAREKYLYVLGIERPINALNNTRKLKSTLAKRSLWELFFKKYGDRYNTVQDYYRDHKDSVTIVDLKSIVPELSYVK